MAPRSSSPERDARSRRHRARARKRAASVAPSRSQAQRTERLRARLPRPLRPFASRDYVVLALAMVASLVGAGMWAVAMVYEVIELGGSPLELSLVGTATSIGIIATAIFGGVAADLLPRRAILRTVEGVNVVAVGGVAALSSIGAVEVWHLAVAGALLGVATGFFFPAYSAILPRILPADDLLAANGIEGAGRPVLQYAAGPAAAGALVAAFSPGDAIAWIAACHLVAFAVMWFLHPRVDERISLEDVDAARELAAGADADAAARHVDAGDGIAPVPASRASDALVTSHAPVTAPIPLPSAEASGDSSGADTGRGRGRLAEGLAHTVRSVREGVEFTVRTPWLRWTLLWAVIYVFLYVGPFEVLTPFVLRDLSLGAESFGTVLAAAGVGSALGALIVSSRPMPRRYLTHMMLTWGFTCLALVVFGIGTELWMFIVASFVLGLGGGYGNVIWGTLLQRRVPTHMLGRVSSLDFFVSLAFMPLSMAVVGPISLVVPPGVIFIAVGIGVVVLTMLVWWIGKFSADEVANPLDRGGVAGPGRADADADRTDPDRASRVEPAE